MLSPQPPLRGVPKSPTDDRIATAALIVNGLTVRPREQVNPWLFALCLLPNFVALPVLAGLGMHRLLRYLDTQRKED